MPRPAPKPPHELAELANVGAAAPQPWWKFTARRKRMLAAEARLS